MDLGIAGVGLAVTFAATLSAIELADGICTKLDHPKSLMVGSHSDGG